MSQSRFIGPLTLVLLAGVWIFALLSGAPPQQIGGLVVLTLIAAAMALMTLRG